MAKILIFEDDLVLAEHWREVFENSGHQVDCVLDIGNALRILEQGGVEVAIIDIFIQDSSHASARGGLMLISKMGFVNLTPKPWIIAVSGHAHNRYLSVLDMAKNLGANEYFHKPIDIQVLLSTVEKNSLPRAVQSTLKNVEELQQK